MYPRHLASHRGWTMNDNALTPATHLCRSGTEEAWDWRCDQSLITFRSVASHNNRRGDNFIHGSLPSSRLLPPRFRGKSEMTE